MPPREHDPLSMPGSVASPYRPLPHKRERHGREQNIERRNEMSSASIPLRNTGWLSAGPTPPLGKRRSPIASLVVLRNLLLMFSSIGSCLGADADEQFSLGVGQEHMNTSCSPAMSGRFDMGLALLHNFWYPQALSAFDQIIQADPNARWPIWAPP
jgi:hypothetical protein